MYPDGGAEAEPSPLLRVLGQIRGRVSPPERETVLHRYMVVDGHIRPCLGDICVGDIMC